MEPSSIMTTLPKRIKGNYLSSRSTQMKIVSNYFPVRIKPIQKIYIFKIVFEPKIMSDNRTLRQSLLKQASPSIRKQINNPVFGGMNIYSVTPPNSAQETHLTQSHKIFIKQIKSFDVQNNHKVLLHFLNNGIRNIMKVLDYMEIGETGKYFNKKLKKNIYSDLLIFPGYRVNFLLAENGLHLRVDSTFKLVQTTTVLNFIDDIYRENQHRQRDEKRNLIKQGLINKIVMTNYGKTRYVRVQDVEFLDIKQFLIEGKQSMTIIQYYKQKYNLSPKPNQPLLKIFNKNKNDTNKVYMLPELCLMTGLPNNFDQMKRKSVSNQTIIPATQKLKDIKNFISQIKLTQQENCLQQLGIKIQNKPLQIAAKILNTPTLYLGKESKVQRGKQQNFNLFSQPIFQSRSQIKLGIIYFNSFKEVQQIISTIKQTSEKLRVDVKLKKFQINSRYNRGSESKQQIYSALKEVVKEHCNMCVIIIRSDMKTQYKSIKKECLQNKKIVTQIVLESTLRKKNARSIHTKILLQLIVKAGNTLWCSSIPQQIRNKTMLVSFDTSKAGQKRRLAGIATLNGQLTKFATQTMNLQSIQNKFQSMVLMLLNFMNKFLKRNKQNKSVKLQQIVLLTNSCPKNEIKMYYDYFIPQFKKKVREIIEQKDIPKLTIIQAKDLSSQRFFQVSQKTGSIDNPPAGLVISDTIVSQNYDFYMVSQKSRTGSTVPIRFNVINSDSLLQQGMLQQLLYSQCFSYANWTGSIKIPAIMQYAKKLARFSSQVLESNLEQEDIITRLYFI